jgi:primosomal protein N' (replication factor Y)
MRCHHCGYQGRIIEQCGQCDSTDLAEVGEGTQRVEQALERLFPNANIVRIDRDSTSRKGALQDKLEEAKSGAADIILGTQLITKGHDFAKLSLVGVLNADQGLYSYDFRATEQLFQQIVQVAGRAGRREETGQVLIQTAFPDHPMFQLVQQHDYIGFAKQTLQERQSASYPPFGYFALIRAESVHQAQALQFLRQSKQQIEQHIEQQQLSLNVMDAIPAPMEKRAGLFRAQLLLSADKRSAINHALNHWIHNELQNTKPSRVRWSVDVDPIDLY